MKSGQRDRLGCGGTLSAATPCHAVNGFLHNHIKYNCISSKYLSGSIFSHTAAYIVLVRQRLQGSAVEGTLT